MQQHSLDMLNNGAPSIPANIYIYIYIYLFCSQRLWRTKMQ